jgi:hypothetical protein
MFSVNAHNVSGAAEAFAAAQFARLGFDVSVQYGAWTSRSKTAAGLTEEIPINWKLTESRIHELMAN